MIGKVGKDAFGEETKRNFEENGVGTKYLFSTDKAPSGVAPITVDGKAIFLIN